MPDETSCTQPTANVPQEFLQSPDITKVNPTPPPRTVPAVQESSSRQKEDSESNSEATRGFCEFTHEYLRQYIELADQKAAFLFAIVSAISAYVLTSKFSPFVKPFQWSTPVEWLQLSGKTSVILFVISAVSCILVVLPRLWRNPKPGLIFWEEIVAVESVEKYAEMACNQTDQSASCEIVNHAYALAGVCKRKYFYLKVAMYLAFLGFILLALYLWPLLPTIGAALDQGK